MELIFRWPLLILLELRIILLSMVGAFPDLTTKLAAYVFLVLLLLLVIEMILVFKQAI